MKLFLTSLSIIFLLTGCESHHNQPVNEDPLIVRPGRGLEECPEVPSRGADR